MDQYSLMSKSKTFRGFFDMTRGLVFYPDRCKDDCTECIDACKKEFGIALLTLTPSKIIVSCHQCESPYCMNVCKTQAITKEKGIVKVNPELCVGCQFCLAACPYGGMYFLDSKAVKCQMCEEKEEGPICVAACKEKALQVVDVPSEAMKKVKLQAQRVLNLGEDLICFVNIIEEGSH